MKATTLFALPVLLVPALAPALLPEGASAPPAAASPAPLPGPEPYKIDGGHSWVLFQVDHLGIGKAWGSFAGIEGSFQLAPDGHHEDSRVELQIDAASVHTNNKKRDDHLRGPDFFNAKEFPSIRFRSSEVEGSDGEYRVTGTLELLGKEREVTATMRRVGEGKDPWGNQRIGFEGGFTIDRTAFGMDYMKDGLGAEVAITLAFEGILQ